MRLGKVLLGCALGVFLTSNVALATHPVPFKANKLITLLAKAYNTCSVPNDSTTILPLPACTPVTEEDPGCNFTAKGKGILKAIVFGPTGGKDIKLIAVVTKLDCPGQQFCPSASFQITTHDCLSGNPGGCTTVDVPNFPLGFPPSGCCTVDSKGNCKIKSSVDASLAADVIQDGNNTNLVLQGCGMNRTGGGVTFRCGLFW